MNQEIHSKQSIQNHESVLNKNIVLKLNASWMPIDITTPRKAIVAMLGGEDGEPPVLGMDVSFNDDGSIEYVNPVAWEDWVKLPVREQDLYVQTKNGKIRAPTVIIARNYNKISMRTPRLCNSSIHERDGSICQYTGEKLSRDELSVDHVIPLDRGGKNEWGNMVTAKKKLNHDKGNRLNEEIGLKLIRKPEASKPIPVSLKINDLKHKSWKPFLVKEI